MVLAALPSIDMDQCDHLPGFLVSYTDSEF